VARTAPVLMIGLDAAEVTLVDRLCDDGKLPTLAWLRRKGCFGTLASEATTFSGSVWPTFYTGKRVPWHGIYHDRLWRHEKMRFEMASDEWLSATPFWEMLDRECRVAIVDVPLVLRTPRSMNGILVSGWGTHDRVFAGTRPRGLAAELKRHCGVPLLPEPFVRPRTASELLALRDHLVAVTQQMSRLSRFLLARGPWDVFCVVLGAPHRGGHHLWDLSQIDPSGMSAQRAELERGLEDVYRACDRAVAEMIEAGPPDARILVFATHGMGPNPGWSDRFADVLSVARPSGAGGGSGGKAVDIGSLRKRIGEAVFPHLPRSARNYLVNRRLTDEHDWKTTRFFPLDMDHAGYVRINLLGRELQGIVEPGPDYEALCDELSHVLSDVRDVDTDLSIVDRVYRVADLAPERAPYRDVLPDLVVTWGERSAIRSHGIRRKGRGEIRWNRNGVLPSLRSGNHRGQGWLVAVGSGIAAESRAEGHHITDLVPTVTNWIGGGGTKDFHGRPIPALCGRESS
jgi:predicted AlkP superfamily phosphohydrolase/phosphomutase